MNIAILPPESICTWYALVLFVKYSRNIMEKYETGGLYYQRDVFGTLSVVWSVANLFYPAILLQFLFGVIPCVFAWLDCVNVDVRSAELKFVTKFLDRAIYKSYFFISLYDNLSNISGFKFGEYRDVYLHFQDSFSILVKYVVLWLRVIIIHERLVITRTERGINSTGIVKYCTYLLRISTNW